MKTSHFPLSTTKEFPKDAEIVSHQLMIKSGMIRRLTSGLYTWAPLGLRVLSKVENVVREEMNKAGALELLMPFVQPAELWQESGRWDKFGKQLLTFKDRHDKDYCLGPTHEEVVTDYARQELKSYRQLPVNFYQIQWKFRDEIRPRFGVMRSREFLMKDAYSFHIDSTSLEKEYQNMYNAYCAIFDRLQLEYRAVLADSGAIGGDRSQEFHVLADSGEDAIVISNGSTYAANIERAETHRGEKYAAPTQAFEKVATPNARSVEDVAKQLNVPTSQITKTLIVHGVDGNLLAICLRGDHSLNEVKAENFKDIASPLRFATDAEIIEKLGVSPGSIGPVNLPIPVLFDHALYSSSDFICGANDNGFHYVGVNFERDLPLTETFDLRNIEEGDVSPDGQGTVRFIRGIEVGHIFQLGNKYSQAMNASVVNENGEQTFMEMGCYGIGVSRIVASAIEQSHDDKGIIWPDAMAPFQLSLIPMNYHKSDMVKELTDKLYAEFMARGVEVLLEDRDIRPGNAFNDHELVGIPHRLVIGERGLKNNELEYKGRKDAESTFISVDSAVEFVMDQLK
ncbi:proline--tRNA ligase [Wohlfahrtiimonas chitiniclastica]|uniref:proline--tRNA ligase n=1 Tax=Wohlfahrtiimonas chitiniclastica TaxID=400946 RepID=UPI001BCF8352|nr:proline--tRNA ligase [Wohlfahrtiimonas chitiniclastica]MBS7827060.1 proline--tRNA ligase [Wohlfahrtiimonas chitiniclastica]